MASVPQVQEEPCFAVGRRIVCGKGGSCITEQKSIAVSIAGSIWNHLESALIRWRIGWVGEQRNIGGSCCIALFLLFRARTRIHFLQ